MQLKKTIPAAIAASILLASCTAKPTEEMPAPIPQATIGEVTTADTATPTENVQAVASDGTSATVSSNGASAVASGASVTAGADGSSSATAENGSVTTSANGSMTVTVPDAGTMTVENGQIAAPGVSVGADGTVKMDAEAAGTATMGQ